MQTCLLDRYLYFLKALSILFAREELDQQDQLECRRVSHLWRDSVDQFCTKGFYLRGDEYPAPCITLPLDSSGCDMLNDFIHYQHCRLVGNRLRLMICDNNSAVMSDKRTALQAIGNVPDVFWQRVERLELTQYSSYWCAETISRDMERNDDVSRWGGVNGLLKPFLQRMRNVKTVMVDLYNNPTNLITPLSNLANLGNLETLYVDHEGMLNRIYDWDSVLVQCKSSLKRLYASSESNDLFKSLMTVGPFTCLEKLSLGKLDISHRRLPNSFPALKFLKCTVYKKKHVFKLARCPSISKIESLVHLVVHLNHLDLTGSNLTSIRGFRDGSPFVTTLFVTFADLASAVNFAQLFPALRYFMYRAFEGNHKMLGRFAEKRLTIGKLEGTLWDYLPSLDEFQFSSLTSSYGLVHFFRSEYYANMFS